MVADTSSRRLKQPKRNRRKTGDVADTQPTINVKAQTETVVGKRPRGNCSISGKVISASTGKPVDHARMYLHYNVTHGSIFVNTAGDGTFTSRISPRGHFRCDRHVRPDTRMPPMIPKATPANFRRFSLQDGEHRTGIVLKAKQACRVSGRILDENGKIPAEHRHLDCIGLV